MGGPGIEWPAKAPLAVELIDRLTPASIVMMVLAKSGATDGPG